MDQTLSIITIFKDVFTAAVATSISSRMIRFSSAQLLDDKPLMKRILSYVHTHTEMSSIHVLQIKIYTAAHTYFSVHSGVHLNVNHFPPMCTSHPPDVIHVISFQAFPTTLVHIQTTGLDCGLDHWTDL